jgi:hypothetical protein
MTGIKVPRTHILDSMTNRTEKFEEVPDYLEPKDYWKEEIGRLERETPTGCVSVLPCRCEDVLPVNAHQSWGQGPNFLACMHCGRAAIPILGKAPLPPTI